MTSNLFILNDGPYGNERAYNALRLASALAGKEGQKGAHRGMLAQLADWTANADKVLVF